MCVTCAQLRPNVLQQGICLQCAAKASSLPHTPPYCAILFMHTPRYVPMIITCTPVILLFMFIDAAGHVALGTILVMMQQVFCKASHMFSCFGCTDCQKFRHGQKVEMCCGRMQINPSHPCFLYDDMAGKWALFLLQAYMSPCSCSWTADMVIELGCAAGEHCGVLPRLLRA